MTSPIHFEIKGKRDIEKLGFTYAEDESKCRGHMFNAIPVEIDIRDHPEYDLADVEADMDGVFRAVLKWELMDAGIRALREVTWDRVFFFNNWWEPRDFVIRYWVRIVGEDAEPDADPHVTRV